MIAGDSGTFTMPGPITTAVAYFVEVRRITTEFDAGPDPDVIEVTSERIRSFTVNADGSVTVGALGAPDAGSGGWAISIFGQSPP